MKSISTILFVFFAVSYANLELLKVPDNCVNCIIGKAKYYLFDEDKNEQTALTLAIRDCDSTTEEETCFGVSLGYPSELCYGCIAGKAKYYVDTYQTPEDDAKLLALEECYTNPSEQFTCVGFPQMSEVDVCAEDCYDTCVVDELGANYTNPFVDRRNLRGYDNYYTEFSVEEFFDFEEDELEFDQYENEFEDENRELAIKTSPEPTPDCTPSPEPVCTPSPRPFNPKRILRRCARRCQMRCIKDCVLDSWRFGDSRRCSVYVRRPEGSSYRVRPTPEE
ncbi:MAG: hypothetical protein CMF62_01005 [Magnetococcales bacterium]|nr:hypothetical protein [Magnetococcales bacterium]|tara:strand:- start:35657 stop:36493 length:837 start_codon:yes stop_codon:yes gene_type:complete